MGAVRKGRYNKNQHPNAAKTKTMNFHGAATPELF